MKMKQTLSEVLAVSEGRSLLFLGREGIFTHDEIARFLKKYGITTTTYLEEGVVATIETATLNPVEEDISNDAYEANIPSYALEEFEKELSMSINDDELLMGIKLSNDQGRVFRLLGNENIKEALFVKLLSMYEWHEDEEDDRHDRDVIMYTLKRYIDIKPNETDLLYSYLTLRRLATEANNPRLLQALIGFQNFEFLIRGKEKVTLRETIARNAHLDAEVISKLVSLRDDKVDVALACNTAVQLPLLQTLLTKEKAKINEALATNINIDDSIFEALLSKEDKAVQLLLLSQPVHKARLALVEAQGLEVGLFATIGANEHLESDVIDALIAKEEERLLCNLAENETLNAKQLQDIYDKGLRSTVSYLAHNPSCSVEMLEMFYETYDETAVRVALASNSTTPESLLRALFARDEFEIYQGLASNASVPAELLDILKVDTRLQNELAKNEVFVKEYETVLDYDKKAVQF